MNFEQAYLVHTHTHNREHIIVDAPQKILAYISYREERESLIMGLI
jgi:hypothetical protein